MRLRSRLRLFAAVVAMLAGLVVVANPGPARSPLGPTPAEAHGGTALCGGYSTIVTFASGIKVDAMSCVSGGSGHLHPWTNFKCLFGSGSGTVQNCRIEIQQQKLIRNNNTTVSNTYHHSGSADVADYTAVGQQEVTSLVCAASWQTKAQVIKIRETINNVLKTANNSNSLFGTPSGFCL